ncbi:MAG TPA: hypothetical protein VFO24_07815 [Usitatibacter sp.]|nr:hypothetical protein [Usitatibacter sp.]
MRRCWEGKGDGGALGTFSFFGFFFSRFVFCVPFGMSVSSVR